MSYINDKNYSWEIPLEWKRAFTEESRSDALAKLEELKQAIERPLLANPDKDFPIPAALRIRRLKERQVVDLTALLAKEVRHPTCVIQTLYIEIISAASKKEKYQKIRIYTFLEAYTTFATSSKRTPGDKKYDEQQERIFFERILTAVLETKKFDTVWSYIESGLTREATNTYNVTASKIMNRIKNGIDGDAIDALLAKSR